MTPARRRGPEILDDPAVDPGVRERSMRDVVRANRWLGGSRAVLLALDEVLDELTGEASLLDVGTGLADLPSRAAARASHRGLAMVRTIGVDARASLLARAMGRLDERVCADALRLPFRTASIDVVLCSQTLHHFDHGTALAVLRELDRVARRRVVIADLRRSWVAATGFRAAAWALRFHPVTRHDGVVSVLRGFTVAELRDMIRHATGVRAIVRRRLGYRITAAWRPSHAGGEE